jgi:hypothetical protein
MRLWDSVKAAAAGVEDDGSFESPDGPEDCEALRAAAFRVAAEDLDLPADWGAKPFGVVMEMGGATRTTTLIAFANGASSFLASTGSGMIGGSSHVHVVIQARRLVAEAADYVSAMAPAAEFPRPGDGAMRFYFLTRDGVLTAEESAEALRNGASALSPLVEAADELVSEYMQYGWGQVPVPPPTPFDLAKALAIVAAIAGLTYAAWLIPVGWLRWPAVSIGLFFTLAALIVPYAMLTAPRPAAGGGEGTAAPG